MLPDLYWLPFLTECPSERLSKLIRPSRRSATKQRAGRTLLRYGLAATPDQILAESQSIVGGRAYRPSVGATADAKLESAFPISSYWARRSATEIISGCKSPKQCQIPPFMDRLLLAALFFFAVSSSNAQVSPYAGHYQFYEVTQFGANAGNPSLIGHLYISSAGQVTGKAIANRHLARYSIGGGMITSEGTAEVHLVPARPFLPIADAPITRLIFSIRNGLLSGRSELGSGTLLGGIIYSNRFVPCTGEYYTDRVNHQGAVIPDPTTVAIMMLRNGRIIGFARNGDLHNTMTATVKGVVVYVGESRTNGSRVEFRLRRPNSQVNESPSGTFNGYHTGSRYRLTHDPKGEAPRVQFTLHPLPLPVPR